MNKQTQVPEKKCRFVVLEYVKLCDEFLYGFFIRNKKHPVPSKLTINPKKLKILQNLEEINVLGSSLIWTCLSLFVE